MNTNIGFNIQWMVSVTDNSDFNTAKTIAKYVLQRLFNIFDSKPLYNWPFSPDFVGPSFFRAFVKPEWPASPGLYIAVIFVKVKVLTGYKEDVLQCSSSRPQQPHHFSQPRPIRPPSLRLEQPDPEPLDNFQLNSFQEAEETEVRGKNLQIIFNKKN